MKKSIFGCMAVSAIFILSCNSNTTPAAGSETVASQDMKMVMPENKDEPLKVVTTTFTEVDPGVSALMKSLVADYLVLKNALTNAEDEKAAKAAASMEKALKAFDKSLLSAEQKKVFDAASDDLKEKAGLIAKNKLAEQRVYFSPLSTGMYELVKAFGAGKTLYHDYCPMALENTGAMWLSEMKEIRNPYYGDAMMTCGTVEEMVQ